MPNLADFMDSASPTVVTNMVTHVRRRLLYQLSYLARLIQSSIGHFSIYCQLMCSARMGAPDNLARHDAIYNSSRERRCFPFPPKAGATRGVFVSLGLDHSFFFGRVGDQQ